MNATARKPDPVDLQEALTSYAYAMATLNGHIIIRLVLRTRTGTAIPTALHTIPTLCRETARLRALLALARLDHANLTAAARATLAADHEGERDPLWYLRDELTARGQLPPNIGRRA